MEKRDNLIVFLALLVVVVIAIAGISYQNNLTGQALRTYKPGSDIASEGEGQESDTTGACTDTDGGNDILNRGSCSQGGRLKYTDYCSGGGIVEASCSGNKCIINATICPPGYSCNNGACVTIACSTNAGCNDGNSCTTDTCVNPGTYQSFCKNDVIKPCNGNGICETAAGENCASPDCDGVQDGCNPGYICRSGNCAYVGNVSSFSETTNPLNAPLTGLTADSGITCADTDGGKNYYKYGSVTISDSSSGEQVVVSTYYDYCGKFNKGYNLKEYYCANNQAYATFYICPLGCSRGKCK